MQSNHYPQRSFTPTSHGASYQSQAQTPFMIPTGTQRLEQPYPLPSRVATQSSLSQNRQAIYPESLTMNRQFLEKQYSAPLQQPSLQNGYRQASFENKENGGLSKNNSHNSSLSEYASVPVSSQYPPKSSSRGLIPHPRGQQDQLKSIVNEQLEEFKEEMMRNFQSVLADCVQKNSTTAHSIESLKRQIGHSKSEIVGVNQRMDEVNMIIGDLKSISPDSNQIAEEVARTVKEIYGDKIEQIERSQQHISESLGQLKETLVKEISEDMNTIGKSIQQKSQSDDHLIYENIEQLKEASEAKIQLLVNQMDAKITLVEKQLGEFKSEKVVPIAEQMQKDIYAKFDECVKEYETELMHLKAQIDSKLDRSQLQEVVQGYRNIKETEIFNRIGSELATLQQQMNESAIEGERQQNSLQERIKNFEMFVETRLREYNARLKERFDQNGVIENALKQHDSALQQFQSDITELSMVYEKLNAELNSHQQESKVVYEDSTKQLEELTKQLGEMEAESREHRGASNVSQQEMDSRISDLDKEIHSLMNQMSQFQMTLNENIDQHHTSLAQDHQRTHSVLDSLLSQQQQTRSTQERTLTNERIETKYDEYLKKYEDFNKEVTSYLYSNQQNPQKQPEIVLNTVSQQKEQESTQVGQNSNEVKKVEEEQEADAVYLLDEKGYLIDERGNYILDDGGNLILLSQEHIEYLRSNDMIQEDDN